MYSISNEFKVKDPEAFRLWAKHRKLETIVDPVQPNSVVIMPKSDHWYEGPRDKNEDYFLLMELSAHLVKSEIAVLFTLETDASTMGYALLVSEGGETRETSLVEAVEQAKHKMEC